MEWNLYGISVCSSSAQRYINCTAISCSFCPGSTHITSATISPRCPFERACAVSMARGLFQHRNGWYWRLPRTRQFAHLSGDTSFLMPLQYVWIQCAWWTRLFLLASLWAKGLVWILSMGLICLLCSRRALCLKFRLIGSPFNICLLIGC